MLIFLSIMIYIRLKYKFWAIQPVFHVYDFRYWFMPPGIICQTLPEKNRYCNFRQIETINYNKLTDLKFKRALSFIQTNYLRNNDNIYFPKKKHIEAYFTGHNSPSFISLYNEDDLLLDSKTNETIADSKLVGLMTTRPVHVQINNGHKDANFDAYYVDYLCVDKNRRKKGLAQEIIQTHHYNQRHLNPAIHVSIFKREDELTGIVPICVYSTYGFNMSNWRQPQHLPPQYKLLECTKQNIHHLLDYVKMENNSFDICMTYDVANLLELIKTGNIFIYLILNETTDIIAAYFFRKPCVTIKKGVEVLSCFASIRTNALCEKNVFIHGYKVALYAIVKKQPSFQFAVLEDIAHNRTIIDNLRIRTQPAIVSPTAYFFYNFAYHTFKPEKVLILL